MIHCKLKRSSLKSPNSAKRELRFHTTSHTNGWGAYKSGNSDAKAVITYPLLRTCTLSIIYDRNFKPRFTGRLWLSSICFDKYLARKSILKMNAKLRWCPVKVCAKWVLKYGLFRVLPFEFLVRTKWRAVRFDLAWRKGVLWLVWCMPNIFSNKLWK